MIGPHPAPFPRRWQWWPWRRPTPPKPKSYGRVKVRDSAYQPPGPPKPLEPTISSKLAKICGLFGSAHDGEVVAAARRAHALVQSLKLTWFDVVGAPQPPDYFAMAALCASNLDLFDRKSADFVMAILPRLRRGGSISEKQQRWLCDLHERAEAAQQRRRR